YVARGTVESKQGVIAAQLAWIAFGGRVYRLTAAYVPTSADPYGERARKMFESFRPLTDRERAAIRVNRLHLERPRAVERPACVAARAVHRCAADRTAIANGHRPDATLQEGQLLKIGVQHSYAPEKP